MAANIREKQKMLMLITVVMLVCMLYAAEASVCTVMGFVSYEDSSKAHSGTVIKIVDIDLGTVHNTKTGGDNWPYPNFYVQSFTCNFGTDRIAVIHEGESKTTRQDFVFDKYPYEVNLTLPMTEKDTVINTDEGSGGVEGSAGSGNSGKSSGSGGYGGPGSILEDFGTIINQSKINKINIGSTIRLYIINDSFNIKMIIGNVTKAGSDSISIAFNTLDKDVLLRLKEPAILDLDNDGKDDTRAELTKLDEGVAYVQFDRMSLIPYRTGVNLSGDMHKENKSLHEEKPYERPDIKKNTALIIMGAILLLLFIIIIIEDKKAKGPNSRR